MRFSDGIVTRYGINWNVFERRVEVESRLNI